MSFIADGAISGHLKWTLSRIEDMKREHAWTTEQLAAVRKIEEMIQQDIKSAKSGWL